MPKQRTQNIRRRRIRKQTKKQSRMQKSRNRRKLGRRFSQRKRNKRGGELIMNSCGEPDYSSYVQNLASTYNTTTKKVYFYSHDNTSNYTFFCVEMRGERDHMEDTWCIGKLLINQKNAHMVSVFDGHGGAYVAYRAARELHGIVEQNVKDWDSDSEITPEEISTILENSFMQFDTILRDDPDVKDSGCTAIVSVITDDKIITAWIGDSRGIVITASNSNSAVVLSEDHKPKKEKEHIRIQRAYTSAIGRRVDALVDTSKNTIRLSDDEKQQTQTLNVSRAFGDFAFKQIDEVQPKEQMVIAFPDTRIVNRADLGNEWFLMLACDGIWDVMNNEQVENYILGFLGRDITSNFSTCITGYLLQQCLEEKSNDNMTALFVHYKNTKIKR